MSPKRVFTLLGLALSLIAGTTQAQTLTKITIGAPNPWQPYSAALMYGKSLGFFKEEGLDPEFISVQGTAVLVPQVANKSITIGVPNPDLMLVALEKGERFPVKFFYNAYTVSPFEFVTLADSPIKSLADLKGRKLGIGALTWGNIPILKAILKDAGVDWSKDLQVQPVGIGPAAWRRLQSREIDGLSLFALQHEAMALTGTSIKRIPIPEKYRTNFSNGFMTHDDNIRQNPKMVEGVSRAIAKSYYACQANTPACVRAFWEFDPSSRPAPDKEAEFMKNNIQLNITDLATVFGAAKPDRLGDYEPANVRALISTMVEGGQLQRSNLDIDQVFTRQFVEAANRWNRGQVKAQAK